VGVRSLIFFFIIGVMLLFLTFFSATFETNTNEIRQMEGNIRMLRNDMQKFNLLIAKNSALQSELAEQKVFLETEFMGKLRVC
jgi:hypothetical protein